MSGRADGGETPSSPWLGIDDDEGAQRASQAASQALPRRIESDPDSVQRDLVRLVLTLIELIRQLMERQALRRVDEEDLTEEQEEDLGLALMRLDEAMKDLQERFDLTPDDLNIDLGPLGPLLPRNS